MQWSDTISIGTCIGVSGTIRTYGGFAEVYLDGDLTQGTGIGAGTDGYAFSQDIPEALRPKGNFQSALPSVDHGLALIFYSAVHTTFHIVTKTDLYIKEGDYLSTSFFYRI